MGERQFCTVSAQNGQSALFDLSYQIQPTKETRELGSDRQFSQKIAHPKVPDSTEAKVAFLLVLDFRSVPEAVSVRTAA